MTPDSVGLIIVAFNATLISALSALVVWFWRGSPGSRWLFHAMLAITFWNMMALLQRFAPDLPTTIWFYKMVYIGADLTTPLLFIFIIEFVYQRPVAKNHVAALLIIPIIGILCAFTNEWHHLYWIEVVPNPAIRGDYIFIHGALYWFSLLYNYLCGVAALLLLLVGFVRKKGPYRRQFSIILAVSVLPIVAGVYFSTNDTLFMNLDVLPITFSLVGLGMVASIFSQKMLDLLPVAREILVENMKEGVIVIDQQQRVADINPAARDIFNIPDPLGRDMMDAFREYPAIIELARRECYSLSEINMGAQGNRVYEIQLVPLSASNGTTPGKLIVIRDNTLRKQMLFDRDMRSTKTDLQAMTDSMTGLYNRRYAEQQLLQEIQRADYYQLPLSFGLIDIDYFKRVNDQTGHICGDRVLVAFSDLLRNDIRSDDFIARIGGEEFLIIFPRTKMKGALVVMERLRRLVEQTVMPCYDDNITISGGITMFRQGDTPQTVMSRADELLSRAKSGGMNRIAYEDVEYERIVSADI